MSEIDDGDFGFAAVFYDVHPTSRMASRPIPRTSGCLFFILILPYFSQSEDARAGNCTAMKPLVLSTRPPVATCSIVTRGSPTSRMAMAVQSHWFSVGSTVRWTKSQGKQSVALLVVRDSATGES